MKFIVVLLCLAVSCYAKQLPSYIQICKPKEVDVSKCIAKNVEALRPKLNDGIPEMAIPKIKPLEIPLAEVKLGADFTARLENSKLWNLDEFVVEDLDVNLDTLRIKLKIKFPRVNVDTQYFVKGKLLVLTLDGSGPGRFNVTNLEATLDAQAIKEEIKGKQHLAVGSIDITPKVEHLSLYLENLFPKNAELTTNANKILNENENIIIEEFSPLVVNIIRDFITNAIGNIFKRFSYDVLFPDA